MLQMVNEDFWWSALAAVMIIAVGWRCGADGRPAIYLAGFGALAAVAWTLDDPAGSWPGWLACGTIVAYGLWCKQCHRHG